MKKCLILVVFSLSINFVCAKNPIRMIGSIYQNLDSALYLAEIKDIVRNDYKKRAGCEVLASQWMEEFNNSLAGTNPVFVLNVNVCQNSNNELFLCPDTARLKFNIFFFGKPAEPVYYIFTLDGKLSSRTSSYLTGSKRAAGKTVRQVFTRIMKKQPEYLLYARQLGINGILYVLNDKIYVFHFVEMREYELGDYLRKFPIDSWLFPQNECSSEYSHCLEIK